MKGFQFFNFGLDPETFEDEQIEFNNFLTELRKPKKSSKKDENVIFGKEKIDVHSIIKQPKENKRQEKSN